MPIFEYQGKKYNVKDEHIDNFVNDFPDATTVQERDGKKYRIRSADYRTFLSEGQDNNTGDSSTSAPVAESAPVQSATPNQEQPWKPTEQEKIRMSAQMNDMKRSIDRTINDMNTKFDDMNEYRQKSFGGGQTVESGFRLNPQTGKMQKTYLTPLGNRYGSKAIADMESFQYRQAADMSVSGQLSRARRELEELKAERERRAKEVHEKWEKQTKENKAPLGFVLAADTYTPMQMSDKENRAYDVAIRQKEEQIKTLEEQQDRDNGVDVGFWRGFGRIAGDVRTWDFGMGDMLDTMTMLNADNLTGENATEGEKKAHEAMMGSISDNQQTQETYGTNGDFWYRAGTMTGYMPSFMLDFALTGGGFDALNFAGKASAKAATRVIGKEAVEEMTKQGFKTYVKNNGIKGLGRYSGNWTIKALGTTADDLLVRAPLMTNTVQAAKTTSDIIDRKLGDVVVDDNGNYDFSNDKTWGSAIWQGEANAIIENYSEMLGAHLYPVMTFGNMSKLANTFGAKRLSAVLAKADAGAFTGIMGQTQQIFNKMGISDYIGEVSEEYYGQLWRTMLNLDDAYQQNPDGTRTNLFATGQFHGDIWGGMALSMGLMNAGKYTMTSANYISAKHGVNKADRRASEILGKDVWEPLRATLDLTTNDDIGSVADGIVKDPDFSNKEKAAVLDYLERSMYMRGFNLGTMVQSRGGEQSKDVQQANESYINGYNSTSGQEMNDAKNMYDYQRERISKIVNEEYLSYIDADPLYWLDDALRNRADWTDERKAVLIDYINSKQVYDGMIQRVRDDIDGQIEQSNAMVESRINQSIGMIQGATMKQDDRKVYVISGNVVPYEDGTGIDLSQSSSSIIIRDAETGALEHVSPDALLSVDEKQNPLEQKDIAAQTIRQQYATEAANKIDGIVSFNPGDTYTIIGDEGQQAQIQVVANEQGIVDNGDGTVNVTDGTNIYPFQKDVIQQNVDAQNAARVVEFENQRMQENIAAEQAEWEASRPQYTFNDQITLMDTEGNTIHGQIADYNEADDTFVVDVDNPINGQYAPNLTREQLDNMVVEYNGNSVKKPSVVSQQNTVEAHAETVTPTKQFPEQVQEQAQVQSSATEITPEEVQQPSAFERIPKDEQGQPVYEQTDSDTAWDAIVEQTEGDETMAQAVADGMVADKEAELKKLEKAKSKGGVTVAEKIAAEKERKSQIDAAKKQLSIWQAIAGTANKRKMAAESERRRQAEEQAKAMRAEQERIKAEQEEAARIEREALNGVPDIINDTPQDARARGYRRVNGHKIDRQEPLSPVSGKEVAIRFNDSSVVPGRIAIIDASQLQPSHIQGQRNPAHFIDEAQPKERKDEASILSAEKIAGSMRPEEITSSVTAFTGAPTVNSRGEVIQGNNRSAALRTMWETYKDQASAYKQYLIDHAEEFGLNAEDITKMEHPVLVNMLDVADGDAIVLGQYVAQDTESGGIERIKPKNALQKMAQNIRTFANTMLKSSDDEVSFSGLVDRNGADALKWMNTHGYISNTQYRSAFDSKGNVTAEAKNDLKGILYQSIFKGGSTQLEEMFNAIPAKAQKAILATAFRDYDSPASERMINEIQNSIMAYYALSQYPLFTEAKNFKDARIAVEGWKRQYQIDDVTGESYLPAENFSNFALHLATMYKGESQVLIQNTFNKIFDLIQGTQEVTLFETPDNTPRTLAQAIYESLNIQYDGQLRSDVLAGDSTTGQQWRTGSNGSATSGERAENGERTSDSTGGTESSSRQSEVISEEETENALSERVQVDDDDWTEGDEKTPTYKRSVLIDGKHTAIQVDEPNEKGDYTGSYFEYDGKRFAGIPEVIDYIDNNPTLGEKIENEEQKVNTNPSDAQKEAGNYKKGHIQVGSFNVTIEQPKGSVRRGTDENGNSWETTMQNTYGYIRGTEGVDGDHIDVFLSNDIDGWDGRKVFVIDQYNEDGSFDEHKVMLGFNEAEDAHLAYLSNYEKGWQNNRKIVGTPVNIEDFEKWIQSSHRKTKPFAEYKSLNTEETVVVSEVETTTPANDYTIEPAQYTTKRGKVLDMQLVKFKRELSKDETRNAKSLAKELKGWYDKEKGGFMMRSEEDAQKIADAIMDESGESLADAAPVSLSDVRKVSSETQNKSGDSTKEAKTQSAVEENTPDTEQSKNEGAFGLVSDARMEELKARLRRKLNGQFNMGIDPETLAIGLELTAGYIDRGIKSFADFAKVMVDDLGDVVRPYLKAFYNGARDMPEIVENGLAADMTPYEEVRTFDVANFDKTQPNPFATAETVVTEQQVTSKLEEAKQEIVNQRNKERRNENEQTSANTEAIISQAETVASDAESRIEKAETEEEIDDAIKEADKHLQVIDNQLSALNYIDNLHSGMRVILKDGRNVMLSIVMHVGEQVSATQMSSPRIGRLYGSYRGNMIEFTPDDVDVDATINLNEPKSEQPVKDDKQKKEVSYNGYKIGEKVIYTPNNRTGKPEEATIYDFEAYGSHKPVLDTGLAPVLYEVVEWTEIKHADTKESTPKQTKKPEKIVSSQKIADLFDSNNADAKRRFSETVRTDMLSALDTGERPYRSILDLRKRASDLGMDVDKDGRTDILLQELVEDGLVRAAREVTEQHGRYSREAFDLICKLYDMQPTISARSSNRIKMQQYSTPLPMSWIADRFAMESQPSAQVLEPTAGNGMLVFTIPVEQVHVNELDETRLDNLREQGFAQVTHQDATEPFEGGKKYDAVIANPPFGKREAVEYDGKMIPGLDPQITLNALASMKDDGRAAIIIGGNMEYASNGGLKGLKPFFTYLYDHYNVSGVIDMGGQLYAKQGTTYPTRMILINGRRSEEERAQTIIYPPVESKALRKAENFEDLYEILNEVLNSNEKTNGTEILRSQQGQLLSVVNQPSGNTDGARHSKQSRTNDEAGSRQRREERPTESNSGGGQQVLSREHRENTGNGEARRGTDGNTTRGSRGIPEPDVQRVGTVGVSTSRVELNQEQKKRDLTEEKLPYRPHNNAFSLNSVAPAAMVEAMDRVLSQIEKENGNIDEFVRKELGYDTIDEAHQALAAEQMDSVAMAIYQMKKGQALIIGDQTGVGKGRQMAALIRWAVKRGEKPVFITQKADLFSDIYRDLVDIGSGDLVPFIFNSDGAMVDSNGNTVHKPLSSKEMSKVFSSGELPDEYDFAVLTYSQVNTGDAVSQKEMEEAAKKNGTRVKKSKASKEGKPTPKATFLRAIAENNYLFLDESHTAAGSSNTGTYLQSILRTAKAVTFASATFAKRPDTMPLYAIRTAMSQAKVEPDKLISIIEKGGVTLQEIMSRELTNAGQMVRRERDMSDVVTDWKTIDDAETVKRARDNYDRTIAAFNAIIKFQEDYVKPMVDAMDKELAVIAETAGIKKGTDKMGVENVPFASKTYNYTKQLMLALKVDAIANEVDAEIKAGRHPVIALESTMESSIKDYSAGEVIEEPTFSASLLRGLDTVMQYTITDQDGKERHSRYSPKQLGEAGEKAYHELQDFIRESTSDIFISPLDAIIERLHEMGYKVGELTGRNMYVERDDDGRVVVRRRTDKDKKRMQREFNNGELDVLILNKSASTGISLHASEKFSDQRQRTMIIAQPLSDINDYMQMIGRIDRTGQVHRGYYINLGLPVPAENRFLMMLSTKLKSLNANTTTSQDSESNDVEAPDLLNKYGSQVVVEYLRDNPEIYEKMGNPLKQSGQGGGRVQTNELDEYKPQEDDARKITGYVALLTTKEQEEFYDDVVRRYNELIKYLNDTGNNDLKITVMPLRAQTLDKRVSSEGIDPTGTNPFAKNSYVEQVEMDVLRKPMKAAEISKTIEQVCKGQRPEDYLRQIIATIEKEDKARIAAEEERYERSKVRAQEDISKQTEKINRQQKRTAEEKRAAIAEYTNETNKNVESKHNDYMVRLNTNSDMLKQRLYMFEVGRSYLMPDNLESMVFDFSTPAIFCGYKTKDSKITASTTLAVFATLDGRRRMEIKLSQPEALRSIYKTTSDNWDVAQSTTLENWDSQIPTGTRKTGFIMTGNILQAIADTQDEHGSYPGQLISYTDIDGNVHDGILMPDKWNRSMLKTSGSPIISRLKQIKDYMPITSHDGKVEITGSSWAKVFYLTVPKTKKDGSVFFENKVLLRSINGSNFYPYRGKLRADIPAENIEDVVKELSKLGVKVKEENTEDTALLRAGEGTFTDDDLSISNDPVSKLLGKSTRTAAQRKAFAERERQRMADSAQLLAEKLHLTNVEIVTDSSTLEGRRAKAKGFYSQSTGRITIVIPNHASVYDVEQTLLHEAVAHYGLRELFGEHFNTFLDNVFQNADADIRKEITDMAKKHGWNFHTATEEYLASLAERTNFENVNESWWRKIKDMFLRMLHKIGFENFSGVTLTDNELRYILWRSYENLAEPGRYRSILGEAADVAKQYELKVGNYTDNIQNGEEVAEEYDELYRDGNPEVHERTLARNRYEQRVRSGMFQTQEALQDSMLGLREAMQAILGRGKNIEDIDGFENAYLGENRLSSVNKAEADAFARLLFKPMLDEVAILAPTKEAMEELTDYMMAKHGLERNIVMAEKDAQAAYDKHMSEYPNSKKTLQDFIDEFRERDYAGLTALTGNDDVVTAEADARQMVSDYESSHDTANLWDRINAVSNAILQKSYECGMMSKDTFYSISSMYEFYIPLRGFDEKTSNEAYAYLTHKQSAFNAPIKKAKGRTSKADDPFANLQSMAESAIMQGNRNKLVKQRFLNFALNHPSDLVSISDLWVQYDDVMDEWRPVFPDNIEIDDTPEEVEQKMLDFEEKMKQLAESNPDLYKRGKDAVNIPYRVIDSRDLRQHQVVVRRNGRDYVITINGNPRAAQALNGQTNPDNETSGVIGAVLRAGEKLNRQLSAFYTTRNPDFIVSNFLRDMLYTNVMTWIKENPRYALRFHRNYLRANPAQMKQLLAKLRKGTLDMNNPLESMFYQFIMNGGETGYANIRDIEQHKNDIRRELKKANGKLNIRKAFSLLSERLDEYNRAVENCARFAAFVTSREMGRSLDRAIYDAKEISVNFNKKGSGAKFYDTTGQTKSGNAAAFASGIGRSGYVFWNAAIQGTANFGRQLKRHPAKAYSAAAVMFLLGALVAYLGGDDDDDDDKNAYYNLPEYVRRSNILFRIGDSWISIPLPVEYRALYGMGELMTSTLNGKEHYTGIEIAEQIATQLSQILPLDLMNDGGLMGLVPSSIKPFAEVHENKSWTGLPIYKDTPWNKNMPEWTKAYKSANHELVNLASTLNEISGGDRYTKGFIDINPANIEHLLEGYFGGVASTIDKMTKTAETIAGTREYDPRSLLLVNRIVKSGDERTEYRAVNNEYFRLKEEHDRIGERLRHYENDTDNGIFDYAEKIDFLYNSPEYERWEIFEFYKDDIDDLSEELKEPLDDDERKGIEAELNEVKKEMIQEMNLTRNRK